MTPNRKLEIQAAAQPIIQYYMDDGLVDWSAVAEEYKIKHYHDSRFFVPMAITYRSRQYVLTTPLKAATFGINHIAHEFGHVILGHLEQTVRSQLTEDQREEEADKFSHLIFGGKVKDDYAPWWREKIAQAQSPLAALSCNNNTRWNEYCIDFIKEKIKKEKELIK
ncbi:MAG: hypothetical protein ACI8Y7_000145 [Candidatus Woesearchaeota archaeon]